MLSKRPARRRQRDDVFGIGAELAAIKAVRGPFPCLIVVDCLVASWAAHWSLRYPGYCNREGANKFPPLKWQKLSNFNGQHNGASRGQETADSGGAPTPLCRWISRATRKISGSSKRGATICMPIGRPSADKPAGALAAGRLTSVIR